MNKRTSPKWYFVAAMLALLWGAMAQAQVMDETVLIRTPVTHDLYIAGRHVEIQAEVTGDIVAAGQLISVNATVEGDIIAAGETINLQARVMDDVRAAGRQIIVSNEIADHIVAAGESITLESSSRIGSWAWLAGETVRISGLIEHELKVAARKVIISGEIKGDVELFAEQIEILEGAHIHGDLIWYSKQAPMLQEGGVIGGQVIEKPFEHKKHDRGIPLAGTAFLTISLMATGTITYLLFPRLTEQANTELQRSRWLSLGLGLAVLLVTPIAIMLLFATVIGSLLALALLACYLVMVLFSVVISIFAVGKQGLRITGRDEGAGKGLHILAFLIAVIAIGILQLIPIIGGFIQLAIVLFGLGGLSLALYRGKPLSV
ncbi:polymer-forming cytoskeletal protein [Photobacterium sp. SDRW27]|uniref:polymer-forming cytoskeletal protein n=1 Tax=Photobacterium obscurum TaxID=2829490 RepID=UPI002242FE25|nr:polymer-forming cytoskeletal protein [Photobacterium obscurum]MCW8329055.1 polymer-forming cytoskeletal protein [Photobacterium obscurum]